jgi:YfiH family protein
LSLPAPEKELMRVEETKCLVASSKGGWWFRRWASPHIVAGLTDRRINQPSLRLQLFSCAATVEAEQVHGGSLAIIERAEGMTHPIAGCDALLTSVPGVALLVRTADCLPIFFAAPWRGVVGLAHVGWRGMIALLPLKMVEAFRRVYQAQPEELHVAIGPAIRACCYEVGQEFALRFGQFVENRGARWHCDLVGIAKAQLRQSGVSPDRVVDTAHCTGCESEHWFSVRREGSATGRLTSCIMLRP